MSARMRRLRSRRHGAAGSAPDRRIRARGPARDGPSGARALEGRWSLVFTGFTHCPDLCPTTLAILARLRSRVARRRLQIRVRERRSRTRHAGADRALSGAFRSRPRRRDRRARGDRAIHEGARARPGEESRRRRRIHRGSFRSARADRPEGPGRRLFPAAARRATRSPPISLRCPRGRPFRGRPLQVLPRSMSAFAQAAREAIVDLLRLAPSCPAPSAPREPMQRPAVLGIARELVADRPSRPPPACSPRAASRPAPGATANARPAARHRAACPRS